MASRWHAQRLAGQGTLAEEVSGPEQRDHACLPWRESTLSLTFPAEEEHGVGTVALRKDELGFR